MERGSSKHGPRHDEALDKDLQGMLGQGGGHREEWLDPEPTDIEADAEAVTDQPADENAAVVEPDT